jgi:DNA (cytosine-5)-methyltransferase 1
MKLLDLFCGSGGASVGYAQAGFDVTGIDISTHKEYPFTFIKADVMTLDSNYLQQFDVIHASPPCQAFSSLRKLAIAQGHDSRKPNLIDPVRKMLQESNRTYIIENVPGSPLINPIQLCGSSFNLGVRRHRLFESNEKLQGSICDHKKQGKVVGVWGHRNDQIPNGGKSASTIEEARKAMGLNYMNWANIIEAIPPAYTKYLGQQLMKVKL